MVDISKFTAPKSDQLNADDLIAGPRTIRIREVREMGSAEQPLAIYFEGDNGKPWKPCKSMMRALMFVWGPDGSEYVGRALTLWRDPSVTWGGEAIGGIRISHMSHMPEPLEFPLTASAKKRVLYRVDPLVERQRKSLEEHVEDYAGAIAGAGDLDELMTIIGGERASKLREAIGKADGERGETLKARMGAAELKRRNELEPATDEPDDDDVDGLVGYADPADEPDDNDPFGGED